MNCKLCNKSKNKFLSFTRGFEYNAKTILVCEECVNTIISSAKANDWRQDDGESK